jgi:molecular chaperone DnaK
VGPDVQGQVNQAVESARKALEGDDLAAMEKAVDELQQASHKLAEAMYQQGGAGAAGGPGGGPQGGGAPGGGPAGGAASGEEEVIDAEYVDVEKGS